ncbi:MAG TPA: hypothetical protein VK190_04970 [Pseudoneobacillus sp.]|nr:hypothetical protein [Pseudoneobacillus sp.]
MKTAMDGILALGNANVGKSDKETHVMVKQVIKCLKTRNAKWPTDELCKVVFQMDDMSRRYFLDTLIEMDEGLQEMFDEREAQ